MLERWREIGSAAPDAPVVAGLECPVGKEARWIADRTGHLTPSMLVRYTRAARTLADLDLEVFPDLRGVLPDLVRVFVRRDVKPANGPATGTLGHKRRSGSRQAPASNRVSGGPERDRTSDL